LAIGAGGVAMWERCSLGLPSVVLSCAANQEPACEYAAAVGAILYLGRHTDVDEGTLNQAISVLCRAPHWLKLISQAAQKLVDGRGALRVARRLLANAVLLREALPTDCRKVFEWRNALSVRAQSMDSNPISYRRHVQWFKAALQAPERALLIAEFAGVAVGVLRYDLAGSSATVSLYLNESAQGQGLGVQMLSAGRAWLGQHWPEVQTLEAVIKQDNAASIATFRTAGFSPYATNYRMELRP
jgi:RimJ/RimL family protein N-acetyltransferase